VEADMSIAINGKTYYRTAEVCQLVGISRNTLFRWLKRSYPGTNSRRDRRGWRLYTKDEINKLKAEAELIVEES
jgi:predicted site-specific integrase-resolvase